MKVNRSQADRPLVGPGPTPVPVAVSVSALYLAGTVPAVTVDLVINNGIFFNRFTDSRVINITTIITGTFF